MAKKPVAGATHDPNVQCPRCHVWVRAQVRINRYLSLAELPKRA